TMRTFHTGGVGTRVLVETEHRANQAGKIELRDCNEVPVQDEDGNEVLVSLKRNGEIIVNDDKGRELEKFKVHYGAYIRVKPGQSVKKGQILANWDPHRTPILAEKPGFVRFVDIELGETVREESTKTGSQSELVVVEHTGEKHPQIQIVDEAGTILDFHHLPAQARIEVKEGNPVQAGQMLARQPKGVAGSADIVGGLPRVTEIFEARRPKDPAIMSEIDGVVELRAEKRRGRRMIIVKSESGLEKEHLVPLGKHLRVHAGDFVRTGEPLVEGPLVLQDILRISGEEAVQDYMLNEVQNVYRSQDQTINDKHIEVIIAQMMERVQIETPGDTEFLPGSLVNKIELQRTNRMLMEKDKKPATTTPQVLGITKAALHCEGFLSAASFQETMKVLTDAALAGKVDSLLGLKENVILGHLIPAGTGFNAHLSSQVVKQGDRLTELLEEAMAAEDVSES
ncbi:MAG: DNA-directed RNA polymerase subunit beta', partial [Planctomycetota bacterium]